jgi:hypothetical protein
VDDGSKSRSLCPDFVAFGPNSRNIRANYLLIQRLPRAQHRSNEVVLEGATMPNGQKYEDWLKDRENRKEDAENDGSS